MSGRTRASQVKKTPGPTAPLSPHSSSSSASRQPRLSSNPWATPTTNADKEALEREYEAIYDAVDKLKEAIIDADESSSSQKRAGSAFDDGLVCSTRIVLFLLITLFYRNVCPI